MLIRLDPPIPIRTPKGTGLAHFLIDDGAECDLKWVCFQDNTGECWTWKNRDIRADKNITQGRDYITPFYDPQDVAFDNRAEEEFDEEYERILEENENIKNNFKQLNEENTLILKKLNDIKLLIKDIINDDHIYPKYKEIVIKKLNSIQDINENFGTNKTS